MSVGIYRAIGDLLDHGGAVLEVIFVVTFVIWFLIIERYWFFAFQRREIADAFARRWQRRGDKCSHAALMIRTCWLSQFRCCLEQRLGLLQMLVGTSLLLGLLGTVIGMIGVFEGISSFSAAATAGIRGLTNSITAATIPAMAGMVAALSGVYFSAQLKKRAAHEVHDLRARLVVV